MALRLESVSETAAKTEARLQAMLTDEQAAAAAAAAAAQTKQAAGRAELERSLTACSRLEEQARPPPPRPPFLALPLASPSSPSSPCPGLSSSPSAALSCLEEQLAAAEARAERAQRLDDEVRTLREGHAALEQQLRSAEAEARAVRDAGAGAGGGASSASSSSAAALASAHATITQQQASIDALQRRLASGDASAAAAAEGSGGGEAAGGVLSSVLSSAHAGGEGGGGGCSGVADGGGGVAAAAAAAAAVAAAEAALRAELRERGEEIGFLKHELAELQSALKRSEKGLQLTFLKNVLVRYMKEGDLENALPVVAQALDFSAQEVADIRENRQGGLLRGAASRFGLW